MMKKDYDQSRRWSLLHNRSRKTLAGTATVLLDHARLESHGLLEAGLERIIFEVGQGVGQPDGEVGDPGQGILRTHELHHIRGRPDLLAHLLDAAHGVVELVMLLVDVMNELAAHP